MGHTILVVDDATFMRTMLRDILTAGGFEVIGEAKDGSEAVEQFRKLNPDITTMDIVMPLKSGIDAVKDIISIKRDAKIIMCSALGQETLVIEAINAGAKDYIVKPFESEKVIEIVGKVAGLK